MAEDIALDLQELRHLQSIAKRPRIVSLISSEIGHLEKLCNENVASAPSQAPAPIAKAKTPSNAIVKYNTPESFSWDQDSDKVKIYLSLEGVQEEKMELNFKPMSFEAKFHDVQGKNYQFAVPKLNKEIVPDKCKVTVKPKRLIITLVKASTGNWLDLHHKEDKLKPNLDKGKDPMAGIMDLMKNMYEEGDDDLKRTIAKAWSDARSGKPANNIPGLH